MTTTATPKTSSTKIKKPLISENVKTNFAMLFLVITSILTGYVLGQVQSYKEIESDAIKAGSAQYNSVTRAFEWRSCKK